VNLANLRVRTFFAAGFLSIALLLPYATGPGMGKPVAQDLEKFQKAGPLKFEVDASALFQAQTPIGPNRVVPGDLLSIRLPVLDPLSSGLAEGSGGFLLRRVGDGGNIRLPLHVHDKTDVLGLSPGKVEARIAKIGPSATANTRATYYKDFRNSGGIRTRPNV
jgi:hypothetical protein